MFNKDVDQVLTVTARGMNLRTMTTMMIGNGVERFSVKEQQLTN